jgi:hypothetical protein
MNINRINVSFLLALVITAPGCAASDSMRDMSKGASQMVQGSARAAVGSVKVVASVAAVPFVVVGAFGQGSKRAGESMLGWGTGKQPLPIGHKTVTAGLSPKAAVNDQEG